jgi:hypothetical protein
MYIRTVSPDSGQILYLDVEVEALGYKLFKGQDEAHRYVIENIKVKETLTLEALSENIKRILLSSDQMPENLEKILMDSFGVSKGAIPELVEHMFPLGVKNRL